MVTLQTKESQVYKDICVSSKVRGYSQMRNITESERGSNPSRIYGLPKLHKTGVPLRPIVSAIGSYTYELSKYLNEIIKPLMHNKFTVKGS